MNYPQSIQSPSPEANSSLLVCSFQMFASLFISMDISRCFLITISLLVTLCCVLRDSLYFVFLCSWVITFV